MGIKSNRKIESYYNYFGDSGTDAMKPYEPLIEQYCSPRSGSVSFSGTDGARMVCGDGNDFSLDGDFTIEWWAKRANTGNANHFTLGNSAEANSLEVYWGTSGSICKLYSGGSQQIGAGFTQDTNWHHYALDRYNGTMRLTQDGVNGGTWTTDKTFGSTGQGILRIGVEWYGSPPNESIEFNGLQSNFRIEDGRSVYGGAAGFTVPTAALPYTQYTVFLALQNENSATTTCVVPSGTSLAIEGSGISNSSDDPF